MLETGAQRLYPRLLLADKKQVIDFAFRRFGVRSFADLGGVWRVEGGYTFYALREHPIERAYLIDTDVTPLVEDRARGRRDLTILPRNFGDPEVPGIIAPVDAVLLFDVLLHQVRPDWNEILAMYAPATRLFVIVNPQYTGGPETIRLLDLGREEYLRIVPRTESHRSVLERLEEIHPAYGRPYRDIHNVWQWGIVTEDLRARMAGLGFREAYFRDNGRWGRLREFRNCAFVFARDQAGSP
jgi:hypothetical protein